MGSKRMMAAPTTTAAAVSSMGRKRTAPASMTAASSAIPSCKRNSTKSTRMMEFRTTIPAPAMKPIIEVAVKKAFIMPCAGRIPTSENDRLHRRQNSHQREWNRRHDDERRDERLEPSHHQRINQDEHRGEREP